jgi:hypothetical protein
LAANRPHRIFSEPDISDRGGGRRIWAESGPLAEGFVPDQISARLVRIERRSVCLPNAVYPSCANAASIFCSSFSAP